MLESKVCAAITMPHTGTAFLLALPVGNRFSVGTGQRLLAVMGLSGFSAEHLRLVWCKGQHPGTEQGKGPGHGHQGQRAAGQGPGGNYHRWRGASRDDSGWEHWGGQRGARRDSDNLG